VKSNQEIAEWIVRMLFGEEPNECPNTTAYVKNAIDAKEKETWEAAAKLVLGPHIHPFVPSDWSKGYHAAEHDIQAKLRAKAQEVRK